MLRSRGKSLADELPKALDLRDTGAFHGRDPLSKILNGCEPQADASLSRRAEAPGRENLWMSGSQVMWKVEPSKHRFEYTDDLSTPSMGP